jgi:hypothetical protein
VKKFSLRHNYNTIELLGPLKHLKISIDYGHVNHNAVYSEAYWFMRFLNKHWDFTSDSAKSQILQSAKQSDGSAKPAKAPVPGAIPDPPFSTDLLDPDTYEKLVQRLAIDLRNRLPQPSTKLRHSSLVLRELGISKTTLWRWSKQGLLKTVKIYNIIYVDLDSLADLEKRARAGEFIKEPHGAAAARVNAKHGAPAPT